MLLRELLVAVLILLMICFIRAYKRNIFIVGLS